MNLNCLLVLDDNPEVLALCKRIAESNGYHAVLTDSVASFKEAYLKNRPTLIVIDILINGGDCSDVIDYLARCRCSVPVALMTGHTAEFLDVMEKHLVRSGLKLVAKVQKKRTMYLIEDFLKSLKIPLI